MYRFFSLFLLVLFSILVGCSSTANHASANRTKVRLVEVTRSVFYAPQYVALNKGFFEEQGLDIDLSNGNGGDKTMTTLIADQSEIVLVGPETAIYMKARGSTDSIIAFAQLTQTDGSFLISRVPLSSFHWDQLRGKTLLGQRRGGMPEMVSEYVQRKKGLIPHKDVKIIQNIDFKNLGPAFAAGTGDFAQLFEPTASKLEQAKKGYIVASFGLESGSIPYTCYLTKRSFLNEKKDVVKRFTTAIYKGQQWVEEHSAEDIANVIKNYFPDTDFSILLRVIHRYKQQDSYAKDPIIDQKEYQLLTQIMKQSGELKKSIPYNQIIDTSIGNQVISDQKYIK